MTFKVDVKTVTAQPAVSIRVQVPVPEIGPVMGKLYAELDEYFAKTGVQPIGPPFSRYFSFSAEEVDFDAGFPVAVAPPAVEGRIQPTELPAGKAAVVWHVGPYDTMEKTYTDLQNWMQENNYQPGMCWEVYWSDPNEVPDPAEWKTEIYWLLE